MSAHAGIDYSLGRSNVDANTGIRYGVISQNSINLDYTDDFEYDYGKPTCPKCGNACQDATEYFNANPNGEDLPDYREHGCCDFVCTTCLHCLDSDSVYSEEALGWSYERDGYKLVDCLDSDIFVLASLFYTRAQFCSPCVPGAGNLDTPTEDGPKTFCLGHDWFDDGKAPYPVYRVSDDSLVSE